MTEVILVQAFGPPKTRITQFPSFRHKTYLGETVDRDTLGQTNHFQLLSFKISRSWVFHFTPGRYSAAESSLWTIVS